MCARVECLPMSLDSETNIQTSPIDAWLKHTTRIQAQFNRLIKNDSIAYMESICTLYLADHNKDAIHEQTILLSKLQRSIYKCHSKILQLSGVGEELSCVEHVKKIIIMNEVSCIRKVKWFPSTSQVSSPITTFSSCLDIKFF